MEFKILIFTTLLLLIFNFTSSATIYVNTTTPGCGAAGATNYNLIQNAINAASNGDTVIVCKDTTNYTESLRVNKSINFYGNESGVILNATSGVLVAYIDSDWVNMTNFTLKDANTTNAVALRINGTHATIYNNTLYNNYIAILLQGYYNTPHYANISYNNLYGLGNEFSYGIYTSISVENVTIQNNVISNATSMYGTAIYFTATTQNIIVKDNLVQNMRWRGINLLTLTSLRNATVTGNTLQNVSVYALLVGGTNTTIANNVVNASGIGIDFQSAVTSNITNNTITNTGGYGISGISCNGDLIANNTVANTGSSNYRFNACQNLTITSNTGYNGSNYYGLEFDQVQHSVVNNNTFTKSVHGIYVYNNYGANNNNIITNNSIYNNTQNGIYTYVTTKSNFSFNNIYNNTNGIYINQSSNNTIHNNTLENNTNYDLFTVVNNAEQCNNTIQNHTNLNGDIAYYNYTIQTTDGSSARYRQLILCNIDNMQLYNFNVSNTRYNNGVLILQSENLTIMNFTITNTTTGFYLYNTSNSSFFNNSIINASTGINLTSSNVSFLLDRIQYGNSFGLTITSSNSTFSQINLTRFYGSGIEIKINTGSSNSTIINSTFNTTNISVASNNFLYVKVPLNVTTVDSNNAALVSVTLNVTNSSTELASGTSDSNGYLLINATALLYSGSTTHNYSPANISGTKNGYDTNSTTLNLTVGNASAYQTATLMLTQTPSASSSSSGGGSGGGATITTNVTSEGQSQEENKQETQIKVSSNKASKYVIKLNETVTFKVNEEKHSITITQIQNDFITLTIKSKPINVTMRKLETRDFDTNQNQLMDLRVKVVDFKNSTAELEIQTLQELKQTPSPTLTKEEAQKEEIQTTQTNRKQNNNYAPQILALIALILAAIAIWKLKNQKKKIGLLAKV